MLVYSFVSKDAALTSSAAAELTLRHKLLRKADGVVESQLAQVKTSASARGKDAISTDTERLVSVLAALSTVKPRANSYQHEFRRTWETGLTGSPGCRPKRQTTHSTVQGH